MSNLSLFGLSLPAAAVPPRPALEDLLSGSSQAAHCARADVVSECSESLAKTISDAQAFLERATVHADELRQAASAMAPDEVARELMRFVAAWPNVSGADLAGYGAQLALDVAERQPCCYAVREGLRALRQTSRFVPSIAETLAAIDAAQKRVRNTAVLRSRIRSAAGLTGAGRPTNLASSPTAGRTLPHKPDRLGRRPTILGSSSPCGSTDGPSSWAGGHPDPSRDHAGAPARPDGVQPVTTSPGSLACPADR